MIMSVFKVLSNGTNPEVKISNIITNEAHCDTLHVLFVFLSDFDFFIASRKGRDFLHDATISCQNTTPLHQAVGMIHFSLFVTKFFFI